MRTETKLVKIYKFGENKEINEKIRDYFNDGDIYSHVLEERIHTLKELAKYIDGSLDYSISCVPDRGEFITINDYNDESLNELIKLKDDCPLTGVCYDSDILYSLSEGKTLKESLNAFIDSIHNEYESMLSDEYLQDHCDANEYEFTADGKIY